ncbi:hypothetical protein [Demequina activiva]|uniref:Leucine rich repeat variant n=1 Tax=Demequina activiva TaxID=1582364 RepID=A0A919UJY9_9MICO|nr:hypothetical protein [Demequina activiva]GIG54806.1 hypothetical protein Dac01nite_15580 [Demequina activiva]
MADGHRDDGSWSRAFMASSGIGVSTGEQRHESPERHEAAGADLPRSRFAELAHHRDAGVREALARRPDCPMAVLATLAHDARTPVRVAAAANAGANAAILEHLARDREVAVLKAVARNVSTPAHVRAALSRHRKADVRHVAQRVAAEIAQTPAPTPADPSALPFELRDRAGEQPAKADEGSAPARRNAPHTYAPRPAVGRPPRRSAPEAERRIEGLLPEGPHPATG